MLRLRHLLLVAVTFLVSCQPSSDEQTGHVRKDIQLGNDGTTVEAVVPQNATLESLLRQQQLSADVTASVVDAIRGVFNPRDLRAQQTYWVTRTLDGLFHEFRYQIDPDRLLRVVFSDHPGDSASSFDVEVVNLPKEYELDAASVTITPDSNVAHRRVRGEPARTCCCPCSLPRCSPATSTSTRTCNWAIASTCSSIARFATASSSAMARSRRRRSRRAGTRSQAYRFEGADGKAAGTTSTGDRSAGRSCGLRCRSIRASRPAFRTTASIPFSASAGRTLASTSARPKARASSPSPAASIELAGWSGEAGRMVRIRHTGGYETSYLHLSGLGAGIHVGAHVDQGQIIGYVGMTGTATGPHLDYRVAKNGTYLNPLTAFSRMPAGEPLVAGRAGRLCARPRTRPQRTAGAAWRAARRHVAAGPLARSRWRASNFMSALFPSGPCVPTPASPLASPPCPTTSSIRRRRARWPAGNPLSFLHVTRSEIDLPPRHLAVRRRGVRAGGEELRGAQARPRRW